MHPVGFFLEGIVASLDPARVELVAYTTNLQEDSVTSRLRSSFSEWHSLLGVSDEFAARRIRDDGIQVLIDLAGHTGHNRLPLFAWRPAPVQVSWLGYWASTGVQAMDYVLADEVSVPQQHRDQFTESIWYLPDTRLCYTPSADSMGVPLAPLPKSRNGYITFGSFQKLGKINDRVLALWGRVLHVLPDARLRVQNRQKNCPATREQFRERLFAMGIAPERVALEGEVPREAYLAAHADVDIILDTFPFPGDTTTCEALWMGVPTLTLAGETMLGRQGASMLACTGLQDWIASDEADFVAKAIAHAADAERLAHLRQGLRDKIIASPLFDSYRFAQNLQKALHEMWQKKKAGI
jgi:predicted O-linked N-acetylglucosamine transferase (SPINDLY family)